LLKNAAVQIKYRKGKLAPYFHTPLNYTKKSIKINQKLRLRELPYKVRPIQIKLEFLFINEIVGL
jgi:hypothetical protein